MPSKVAVIWLKERLEVLGGKQNKTRRRALPTDYKALHVLLSICGKYEGDPSSLPWMSEPREHESSVFPTEDGSLFGTAGLPS